MPEYKLGTLYLYEEPWWLALCGWFIDKIGYGCRLLHWIKFPGIISFRFHWPDKKAVTLKDYYGDLGHMYHCWIYMPLFYWYEDHPKKNGIEIELGYDKVKELFGKRNPKFFEKHENT